MKWKKPETEDAWEEYFSAYMDGELSLKEKYELEKILKNDSHRAAQLEELRNTSDLLQEWKIDTPLPEVAFIREVRSEEDIKQRHTLLPGFRFYRLRHVLPSFMVGILVGIVFMSFSSKNSSTVIVHTTPEYLASEYAISSSQADQLLAEVDAAELKRIIMNELKRRNVTKAMKTFNRLKSEYPESQALKDLENNRKFQFLTIKSL